MTQHSETPQASAENSDELRDDVERTRERVSADVEALGAKLSPANLKAEAKQAVVGRVRRGAERVREGVESAETSVVGFCRDNAIPLSLLGAGLGLLIYNSRRRGSDRRWRPDHSVVGRSAVYDETDSAAPSKLGQLKGDVRQGMQRFGRAAEATAEQARDKFEELEQTAREQAHHARQIADRALAEQPLVLGAVVLGAGLAVGLSLPATDSENKLVGQYRERLVADAKRRVGELGKVAENAADAASDAVKQGVSGETARSAAE